MKLAITTPSLLLSLAISVSAAPIENEKRQLGSGLSLPSLSSGSLPTSLGSSGGPSTGLSSSSGTTGTGTGSLGTGSIGGLGGLTGSSGLGSLGGSSTSESSGLGSLGGLTGPSGSTSGLGSLGGASSGRLGSLGGLSSSGSNFTGLKEKRQFDLGSLLGGSSGSGTSGLSGLTGSAGTSGFGSLGSLGGLTGTGTSTGTSTDSTAASSGTSGTSTGTSTTSADGSCKSVTLLFARGTGETGTMGSVIGPPLASALESQLGADKVASEGVDYAASAGGNANLGASGGPAMASQAQSILSSCPDTKLVLSGYSQGAMVVHNALSSQGLDGSKVAAAVLFGDPFNGQALDGVDASKVKEFCGGADTLCSGGGGTTLSGSHLSYGGDTEAAAQFVVSAIGA
ncbi:Cutinase [Fulvia fulva]|nr:Cutinase [Fulvia fulva]